MSNQDFRALLAALNFESSYDPTKRELTIRVTLVPELTHPDGPRASLLVGAPGRIRTCALVGDVLDNVATPIPGLSPPGSRDG